MKTKLLIVAALVLAVLIGFAVRRTQQIRERQATVASLAGQRAELSDTAAQLERQLRATRAALAGTEENSGAAGAELPGGNARGIAAPAGQPTNAVNAGRRVNYLTLIANDPRWRAEHLRNFRVTAGAEYARHFKVMGFSPEQIERFKEVEVELEQARMDLQATIDEQELDPDSAAYKKLWDDYNASRVSRKAAVLGDLANRYFDYVRSRNVRDYSWGLAFHGMFTGEPVTRAQIERAGDILAANCQRAKSTDAYPGWAVPATLDWPAASEQLKAVLSPAQIDYIRLQVEAAKLKARVDERTKLLTAQFKQQSGGK